MTYMTKIRKVNMEEIQKNIWDPKDFGVDKSRKRNGNKSIYFKPENIFIIVPKCSPWMRGMKSCDYK